MESKSDPDSEFFDLEMLLSDYASDTVKDIYAQFNTPPAVQRRLLFTAIRHIGVMLTVDPALVNEEFFLLCVANDAADYAASLAPKPPPQVSSPSTLARVFKRGNFAPDSAPALGLYTWQSELPDGLGPLLYATAQRDEATDTVQLLLETGELKEVSKTGASLLLSPAELDEYATAPLHLLACECVRFGLSSASASLGSFNVPLRRHYLSASDCTVFENPPPGGLLKLFRVDDWPYRVRLESTDVPDGGFSITAQLLNEDGFVVMRLDTPRRFSVSGVYLFPMQEAAYALVVH